MSKSADFISSRVLWSIRIWDSFSLQIVFEPAQDKTNKMTFAPSEDSDQPGIRPVCSESSLSGMKKPWVHDYP